MFCQYSLFFSCQWCIILQISVSLLLSPPLHQVIKSILGSSYGILEHTTSSCQDFFGNVRIPDLTDLSSSNVTCLFYHRLPPTTIRGARNSSWQGVLSHRAGPARSQAVEEAKRGLRWVLQSLLMQGPMSARAAPKPFHL